MLWPVLCDGTIRALPLGMGVQRYQDLIAWQTAEGFREEVERLIAGSPGARRDFNLRDELLDAARSVPSNIAEGFLRDSPGDFRRFLGIALGSLGEAEVRLGHGVRAGYFVAKDCQEALRFGRRCAVASARLKKSQLDFMRPRPPHTRPGSTQRPNPKNPKNPST